jgi:hypothetical protein
MGFFQNLFDQEYQGYLILADRKLAPTFKIAPNRNLQSKQIAWNKAPYDFSVNNLIEFNFAWDTEFKQWSKISIDVAGGVANDTKAFEVVNKLNSEPTFSSMFTASVSKLDSGESVLISKKTAKNVKFYFGNSGAEEVLGFNKKAGVAELPDYFERHTIKNINNFKDSVGQIIKLDETDPLDQAIIENAGFDPSAMKEDWELLSGRGAGLFTFQKITVDSSDRITQIIEYPAGSVAGDFARKINYEFTGTNSNPSKVTEIPHVLTDLDLISPPTA